MAVTIIRSPTVTLPDVAQVWLTLDEVKAQIRVDGTDEDLLLGRLIDTAREFIEAFGIVVQPRSQAFAFEAFGEMMNFPLAPVRAVTAVSYTDSAGGSVTLDPGDYRLLQGIGVWRLAPAYGTSWPSAAAGEAVTVTAQIGWAVRAEVPVKVRSAALLLVAHYYKHREDAVMGTVTPLPNGVMDLLNQHRLGWLG